MAKEKKTNAQMTNDDTRTPLFTGDFKRDTVISEGEKAAEVSQVIFNEVVKKVKKDAK